VRRTVRLPRTLLPARFPTANLFATLALRSRIELHTNIDHAVAHADLSPPRSGDAFPR
jgi:hypothetical protein